MNVATHSLEVSTIRERCKPLRLPAIAEGCERMAEAAIRERHTHLCFLDALLQAEMEERAVRAVAGRLHEARLPRVKTLEEFDFTKAVGLSASLILGLASGGYLERKEPVLFLGDCGTGKTHLATGLCVAACRQGRRVRFTTAAGLVNELLEAQHQNLLARALARYARYDLVCIDELGYVPLAELGTELIFQVISERAEKASVMITTNLPFSEWTKVFTNARLCKAMLDRLTDRAHIVETGSESFRFRRTMERHASGVVAPEAQGAALCAPSTHPRNVSRTDPSKEHEIDDAAPEASHDASNDGGAYRRPGIAAGDAQASRDASGGKR